MEDVEALIKGVHYKQNKEILTTIINALMHCTHCDSECPFYKEYLEDSEKACNYDPLWYCQGIMAARLVLVRTTLEGGKE